MNGSYSGVGACLGRVICDHKVKHHAGEFGIVFKGYIVKSHPEQSTSFDEYLAIKILKGRQ